MTDSSQPRHLVSRARVLGRRLLQIYEREVDDTPVELLELLDIAQSRLEAAGYSPLANHDDLGTPAQNSSRKN